MNFQIRITLLKVTLIVCTSLDLNERALEDRRMAIMDPRCGKNELVYTLFFSYFST